MTPTKKQRSKISAIINKWRPILYLNKWNFDVCYLKQEDVKGSAASIQMLPQYFSASLEISPLFWKQDNQEEIIVHELCHLLTAPLNRAFSKLHEGTFITEHSYDDLMESVTSHLTNIVFHNK